jgi:hypothetical protein
MGYWMYVCSRSDEVITVETLREFFEDDDIVLEVFGDQTGAGWDQISIDHPDGTTIALLNLRTGDQVAATIAEDTEQLLETLPRCNAEWVADFLRGVKTIYLFQILNGVDVDDGWDHVRNLQSELRDGFDGILYAEREGYSNPAGYHITWEFSDDVSDVWRMALYDPKYGIWRCFQMELSNAEHREAFCAGRVPDGVETR